MRVVFFKVSRRKDGGVLNPVVGLLRDEGLLASHALVGAAHIVLRDRHVSDVLLSGEDVVDRRRENLRYRREER